jgi:hypothetical protein
MVKRSVLTPPHWVTTTTSTILGCAPHEHQHCVSRISTSTPLTSSSSGSPPVPKHQHCVPHTIYLQTAPVLKPATSPYKSARDSYVIRRFNTAEVTSPHLHLHHLPPPGFSYPLLGTLSPPLRKDSDHLDAETKSNPLGQMTHLVTGMCTG